MTQIKNKASKELETTIYTASSPLANPIKLLCEILSDIWKFRELIGILFMRDLKGAYRQTYFGYAWILVPPLANTAEWKVRVSLGKQRAHSWNKEKYADSLVSVFSEIRPFSECCDISTFTQKS